VCPAFVQSSPELEVFEAAGNRLTDATIDLLCSEPRCDYLRVLNLSSCDLDASQAKRIVESCRFLQVLDLSNNDRIDGSVVFLSSYPNTRYRVSTSAHDSGRISRKRKRSLSASSYDAVSGPDQSHLCDCGHHDAANECPAHPPVKRRLVNVAAINDSMDASAPMDTATSVPLDIQKQFLLYKLNISGSAETVDDLTVQCIAAAFPSLTELDLSNCRKVTNLSPILQKCSQLSVLNISGTNVSFAKSRDAPAPSNLEEFRYSGSGCIDTAFEDFISGCTSSLRILELRNKVFEDPSMLSRVLEFTSSLSHLDLYGSDVDGSMLRPLIANKSLRSTLTSLNLGSCIEMSTVDWMDALALLHSGSVSFSGLSSFCISGLKDRIPLDSLALLGRNSPNVVSLSLGHVSDTSTLRQPEVAQILSAFPHLRNLEVWSCESISLTLLSMIPQVLCRNIESIQVCSLQARAERRDPHADHEDEHDHRHLVPPRVSSLTLHQVSRLQRSFPKISFKIWQHSVQGDKFYQEINPKSPSASKVSSVRFQVSRIEDPLLADDLDETHDSDDVLLAEAYCRVSVVVDGSHIWTNENSISLDVLSKTVPRPEDCCTKSASQVFFGGSVPLVRDWCCECNIDDFAGVVFSADRDHINWHIREPGPEMFLRFNRAQYVAAAHSARAQLESLLAQIRSERAAARITASNN
jgi:Leucine-rich repeat (LRR) protein